MSDTHEQRPPASTGGNVGGNVVLTDRLAPLEPDPWMDDDPFVDTATGKRKKLEKAESSSIHGTKRAKKAERCTVLKACCFEELPRVLPYAEDVSEGPCVIFSVYNDDLVPRAELEHLVNCFCGSSTVELQERFEGGPIFRFDDDASFGADDLAELQRVADLVSDKLIELNGTGSILVVDGGQVNTGDKKARKGDIAMLTLKWALLMLKLKDRALHDGLRVNGMQPGNSSYRGLLLSLGRATSLTLMRKRAREHGLDHSL
tara:strand:+ start:136 stop:915 length:780 start_codon:yes stop_codon:yes gene_type:complete